MYIKRTDFTAIVSAAIRAQADLIAESLVSEVYGPEKPKGRAPGTIVDEKTRRRISRSLRKMYKERANEEVQTSAR